MYKINMYLLLLLGSVYISTYRIEYTVLLPKLIVKTSDISNRSIRQFHFINIKMLISVVASIPAQFKQISNEKLILWRRLG
jgi:hypothetical protein